MVRQSSLAELRLRISPFGAPAEDVFKSEVAVLVGAGIGVTVSEMLCVR